MKNLFIAALLLLPFKAFSQGKVVTIDTKASQQILSLPGEVFSAQGNIIQRGNGAFAVSIGIQYRSPGGKLAHLSYAYDLLNAEFEKKGNDLYINHDGESDLIAHHRWYYSPAWMLTEGKVKILSRIQRVTSRKITLQPVVLINYL